MTREQLRDTKDFNSLSRDTLRQEARRHNVPVRASWGGHRPIWDASKDELVLSFNAARDSGRFGKVANTTGTDSPNVTVKQRSIVAFLKGTGCHGSSASVAAVVEGDNIVIYPEVGPSDWDDEDAPEYEKFTTTADDLRVLLRALGV